MPESATRLFTLESVRVGVVGNISACHADARGSIPRRGDATFFFLAGSHCVGVYPGRVVSQCMPL